MDIVHADSANSGVANLLSAPLDIVCIAHLAGGALIRLAHHAGPEVGWREADEDAEQDHYAAVEDAFDGSIDSSVRGLVGGCRHKDRVSCHVLLRLQGWVLRGRRRWTYRSAWKISRQCDRFTKSNSSANAGLVLARGGDRRRSYRSRSVLASLSASRHNRSDMRFRLPVLADDEQSTPYRIRACRGRPGRPRRAWPIRVPC
jgi:hypothetical protein